MRHHCAPVDRYDGGDLMAMTNTARVNRRWIDRLVYQVSLLDGHLAPYVAASTLVELGDGPGILLKPVTVKGRSITLGFDVRPVSFRGRQETMDAIKSALSGVLEVELPDLPGRVLYAELQDVAVDLYTGAHAQLPVWVSVTLLASDPAREDVEPVLLSLSTTRQPCPIGNDTIAPVVEISGGCTNPAIVLRDRTGAEVSRTQFAIVLGANDALRVDSRTGEIERWVAGVRQTGANHGLAAYQSGSLPLLSPEDGVVTMELAADSGTSAGSVEYRRRW